MDFSSARVLLTNDDGIQGRGLIVLKKLIEPFVKEVFVIAPELEQSGASHSLTLRQPLRIRKVSRNCYAVQGTPTDAVLLGISEIMKDHPPDLVLSGINAGANLGDDVTYSGTVAAAMEGTLLGIRSLALSQVYSDRSSVDWDASRNWIKKVLDYVRNIPWPSGVLLNVNFPPIKNRLVIGIEATSQGHRKIGGELAFGVDPRGEKFYWIGQQREEKELIKGTDMEAISRGAISLTPLGLDLTHRSMLNKMRGPID